MVSKEQEFPSLEELGEKTPLRAVMGVRLTRYERKLATIWGLRTAGNACAASRLVLLAHLEAIHREVVSRAHDRGEEWTDVASDVIDGLVENLRGPDRGRANVESATRQAGPGHRAEDDVFVDDLLRRGGF